MFLVGFTFNEDGEAALFRMIDDDAAKGTKEIEQPKEGGRGREFISSVVLRVVTRERIDKVQTCENMWDRLCESRNLPKVPILSTHQT